MKSIIMLFLLILPLFVLFSCDYIPRQGTMLLCNHPWVAIGFDSEVIGTTIGEVETWIYQNKYPEFIHTSVNLPLGVDSFDIIASKYGIYEMVQMYRSNRYPILFYEISGVYPLNVFLVKPNDYQRTNDFINEIADEVSVLYIKEIDCSKKKCNDALWGYKPKP